ncbi:TlpA family protein disulfide reductase [Micromonospora sp. NPDC050397]|uniref:TlpA family protein disulfide reductase n=1 Tax=Micromonospora sp. NPDC050397 TaxID=3364279 RepID=UPI00384C8320
MLDSALTGPLVVTTVLVAATAFGLWRRRRDGRLRPVLAHPTRTAHRTTAPGAVQRRVAEPVRATPPPATPGGTPEPLDTGRPGAARSGGSAAEPGAVPAAEPASRVDPELLTALGVRLGTPATLLQFSSAFCQPCRATRRVLGEVAGLLDGVRHVEVDAESQLAAVRTLDIWRTPTTLVVDADGRIVARAAGVPAKAQVIAALAPLLTGADR